MSDKLTDEQMSAVRTLICGMSNSQLRAIKTFVEHEQRLSETAIAEGLEVRQ